MNLECFFLRVVRVIIKNIKKTKLREPYTVTIKNLPYVRRKNNIHAAYRVHAAVCT